MKAVVDTNVLLIANGQHADVSPECVETCVLRLRSLQDAGTIVVDDSFRIFGEYLNKTQVTPPKGVGDVFLKWLLRNAGNARHVQMVSITESATDTYIEFPDQALQPDFDAPDRKFAAVANAHSEKPPILQAADCKWLNWWTALSAAGVAVEFLCPADTCRFYAGKFPDRPLPELPQT